MQIKRLENFQSSDALLLLLREEDCENLSSIPNLNDELRNILSALISRKDFKGKKGSLLRVPLIEGNLYLLGLGEE